MRVLIVDDSQIMRKIIAGALRLQGLDDFVEASDGRQAVEIVERDDKIRLIMLDWNMPVMTGLEVVKKLREIGNDVPIIMVTAESEKVKVLEAMKSGANDYLVKPFSQKDFAAKLEKYSQIV
jgi:two-component system, chemotaxis family, chemotaxis protein CheY